jgi:hypothetical protein
MQILKWSLSRGQGLWGAERTTVSRGAVVLVYRGAGHQESPLSTGRPLILQRDPVEDSSTSAQECLDRLQGSADEVTRYTHVIAACTAD